MKNNYEGPIGTLTDTIDAKYDLDDNTVGIVTDEWGGDQKTLWLDPNAAFALCQKIANAASMAAFGRPAVAAIIVGEPDDDDEGPDPDEDEIDVGEVTTEFKVPQNKIPVPGYS